MAVLYLLLTALLCMSLWLAYIYYYTHMMVAALEERMHTLTQKIESVQYKNRILMQEFQGAKDRVDILMRKVGSTLSGKPTKRGRPRKSTASSQGQQQQSSASSSDLQILFLSQRTTLHSDRRRAAYVNTISFPDFYGAIYSQSSHWPKRCSRREHSVFYSMKELYPFNLVTE